MSEKNKKNYKIKIIEMLQETINKLISTQSYSRVSSNIAYKHPPNRKISHLWLLSPKKQQSAEIPKKDLQS